MNYFAYGSNMDVRRMKKRNVTFRERRAAYLCGYRLEFNKVASDNPLKGYANIVPDHSSLVEGALYEIDVTSLLKLDKCEGYPNHYLHIPIKVLLPNESREFCAITYIANPSKVRGGLKPSREYLCYLLAGKDVLSKDYFDRLETMDTLD